MQFGEEGPSSRGFFALYREGRLSKKDLSARLLAVQTLEDGKLRPQVLREKDAGIFVGAKVGGASASVRP